MLPTSHSDSNLALNEPFLWLLKHGEAFGHPEWQYKTTFSAFGDRGNAVEAGVNLFYTRPDCTMEDMVALALHDFLLRREKQEEDLDEAELKEYSAIPHYIRCAQLALTSSEFEALDQGKFITTQRKVTAIVNSRSHPQDWRGYIDFHLEKGDWDLKTTTTLPSDIRPSHRRQLAFYGSCTGNAQHIVYVKPVPEMTATGKTSTAKAYAIFSLDQSEIEIGERGRRAVTEYMCTLYEMGWEKAMRVSPPRDMTSIYWDVRARAIAKEIWGLQP